MVEQHTPLAPARRGDPDGPLGRLRAATADAHRDLDTSLGVLDRPRERPWDLAHHRRWLELTWGLLAPIEAALAAHAATDPGTLDVASRARADLVLADLRAIGVHDPDLRVCPDVPAVADRNAALGVCYVLDGSTLGGRLIARSVVDAGIPPEATTSLTGREGTGGRWRETTAAVDAAGLPAVPAMAQAALATFRAYRSWLGPLTLQRRGTAVPS